MPKPRDRQSLIDINTNIKLVKEFVAGISLEDLYEDVGRQYQVIHGLEIIGEAARRLSPATCATIPQVAWRDWIDFRNILSHAYDDVNLEIVWNTITEELPELAAAVDEALSRKLPGE